MKIEIEVEDVSLLAGALNNAVATYRETLFAVYFGCDVPIKLEKLKEIPFDKLQKRFDCIENVYKQVLEIEKESS